MGKRRKVPEDLMGTILNEGSEIADEERTFSEVRGSSDAAVSWDERPERVGVTFNLSKQVNAELERFRRELRLEEGDVRPSRSEVAELALRLAVEDALERGEESELVKRLGARHAEPTPGEAGRTNRFSVDEAGFILKTTYDEAGGIVDEDVVGNVSDLPVEEEYVDDEGRLVSVAKDELGNTFEQVMDEELNALGTRLLPNAT